MKNNEYIANKYKGTEWGIFGKSCNAWLLFGTKKEMQETAKRLNNIK